MTSLVSKVRIEDVLEGGTFVDAETRVSSKSRFGDEVWDFTDPRKMRLSSVAVSRLRIDWGSYCLDGLKDDHRASYGVVVPRKMLHELKVFAFLYFSLPSAFGLRGVQSVKPQTLVPTMRALLRLFSDIVQGRRNIEFGSSLVGELISSLSDVDLRDIREALRNSDRSDGDLLKKGLKLLASPIMSRVYSQGKLRWNVQDVGALQFRYAKTRADLYRIMPNELFRFLSNSACADVIGFLRFIGHDPCDKSVAVNDAPLFGGVVNGARALGDYVSIRQADREYAARCGKRQCASKTRRKKFVREHGIAPREFFGWISRIQRAAFTVVGLYTGARYSDLTTFTNECIQRRHGVYVLVGTHVKAGRLDAEEGADIWPAIPIMRDAVNCLKQIARITFNNYLIAATETVSIGSEPRPLSPNGFTGAINLYLREIDTSGRWVDWHVNAHQLRHTLANQLARADVGLIFIAHQMKHLYTAMNALPPDVTMMYGNVGELAQQRALHSESAYLEAAKELYSPSTPVAGGGASAFMERRKAYFEGMAAHGWSVDDVLEQLARQGLPFASVGIGYCGGRRDTIIKNAEKDLPPCIGSLQCNPGICKQALITKTHEPAWRKILEQNRALALDPRMQHAKEPLLAAVKTAEEVLEVLGRDLGVS